MKDIREGEPVHSWLWAVALKPSYDGPAAWLWFTGIARVGLLALVAGGAHFALHLSGFVSILSIILLAASVISVWYLAELRRDKSPSAILT